MKRQKLLRKIIVMIDIKLAAGILDQDLKIDIFKKVIVTEVVDEKDHKARMEIEDTSVISIEEDLAILHLLKIPMTGEAEIVEIAEVIIENNRLEGTKNIVDIIVIAGQSVDHLLDQLTLEIKDLEENQEDKEAKNETTIDNKINSPFSLEAYMKEPSQRQWILDSLWLSSIPKHVIKRKDLSM